MEKRLDGNYTRMLWAILNKSWKQQLYSHLPPIAKTIQVRQIRHARHCWRSRDELISDILLWTPSHGWAKAGWPAKTYLKQLCTDKECRLEDLPGAMNDRDGWQERVRKIHAGGARWWWYTHCSITSMLKYNTYYSARLLYYRNQIFCFPPMISNFQKKYSKRKLQFLNSFNLKKSDLN